MQFAFPVSIWSILRVGSCLLISVCRTVNRGHFIVSCGHLCGTQRLTAGHAGEWKASDHILRKNHTKGRKCFLICQISPSELSRVLCAANSSNYSSAFSLLVILFFFFSFLFWGFRVVFSLCLSVFTLFPVLFPYFLSCFSFLIVVVFRFLLGLFTWFNRFSHREKFLSCAFPLNTFTLNP